jgi:hypothetical protein
VLVNTVVQTTVSVTGTGPFKVGGYSASNSLPSGSLMDEFRLYNRALTVAEIQDLLITATTSNISVSACGSYTVPSGDETYTTSGTYMDTIPNVNGCDSVMTIDLTINQPSAATISATACDNYTSPSGNYNWTVSGTYTDTIPNAAGCDSVITVELIINLSSGATISPAVCGSYISPSGNYVWNTSGTYMDTIPNAAGCDSVITVNLVVNMPSGATINETVACDTYVSPSGNYTWNASGTYFDTIPNAAGCDSILTINLVLNPLDTTIAVSGITLTANEANATYQWVECPSMQAVSGATGQSFTPAANGSYAVMLTGPDCEATSGCEAVTTIGIEEQTLSELSVFPNPVKNELTIANPSSETLQLQLFDAAGKLIATMESQQAEILLDMSACRPGVYLLKAFDTGSASRTFRIVRN